MIPGVNEWICSMVAGNSWMQVLMDLIGVLVTCLISSALLPVDQKATAVDIVRVVDR